MHTLNRFLVLCLLCVIIVVPGTSALVARVDSSGVRSALERTIGEAALHYRQRTSMQAMRSKSEAILAEAEGTLAQLEPRKRRLRADALKYRRILATIEGRHGVMLQDIARTKLLITAAKMRLERAIRRHYVQAGGMTRTPRTFLLTMLDDSGSFHELLSPDALSSQQQLLADLTSAVRVQEKLAAVLEEREGVLEQYHAVRRTADAARRAVATSASRLQTAQQITADVHAQVLKLQSELARIDARLRETAERELIRKGLLTGPTDRGGLTAFVPRFHWPVYGRVTADFHSDAYERLFGVPHHAVDISAGQGTPVASAAEGVVFLVRDGGETGYTYVLIGHRGSYATLYGHLSSVSVQAGQEVSAGQIIGLSGGTPGTSGAGPMTTGPHLHFEVIKSGVNVDPLTVLP